ncbi:hypothetical protein ABZ990_10805 [Streptomyces sp. NPDC046203]|uniref:hypothetical protein n=1 Tax=Streptomyces sp. NPDC046203 TaxID=3154602 RepID=UPI0033D85FD8
MQPEDLVGHEPRQAAEDGRDARALPARWTSPLKNRLSTSVPSFDGVGFDTPAALTHSEAVRP